MLMTLHAALWHLANCKQSSAIYILHYVYRLQGVFSFVAHQPTSGMIHYRRVASQVCFLLTVLQQRATQDTKYTNKVIYLPQKYKY